MYRKDLPKTNNVNTVTKAPVFNTLNIVMQPHIELLEKFAHEIKDLILKIEYNGVYTNPSNIKEFFSYLYLSNDYSIKMVADVDSLEWNCVVLKPRVYKDDQLDTTIPTVVFTFTLSNQNIRDIATTIFIFTAGTPSFKVNQTKQLK